MPGNDGTGPLGNGRGGRGLGPCGRGVNGRGAGRGAGLRRGGGFANRTEPMYSYDKESLQAQKQELEEQMKRLTDELNKG